MGSAFSLLPSPWIFWFDEKMPNQNLPGVLTVSVMTHPRRAARAERLCSEIGPERAWTAVDPRPEGPSSALRAARVAFGQATREKGGHHLVLQDDAILSPGFVGAVCDAVRAFPEAALSFFVEWGSRTAYLARWAAFTGADAVSVINPYMPTLATVVPREVAVELARFLEREGREDEPDDREVLRFLRGAGVPTRVMVPNAVDHDDLPSIAGNSDHGPRRAVCTAARPRYGGSVLRTPRYLPFLRWNLGSSVVIDLDHDVPEAHRPTRRVLTEWGATERDMDEAFADSGLSSLLGAGREVAFEAWLTAVGVGAVQERHWPGTVTALRGRRGEPLVRGALESFVPGMLRTVADPVRMAARSEGLALAALSAMEYGATHVTAPDVGE